MPESKLLVGSKFNLTTRDLYIPASLYVTHREACVFLSNAHVFKPHHVGNKIGSHLGSV